MNENPILDELYEARAKLLADAGGDVHKYLEGVRRRETASGRLLQQSPSRAAECATVAGGSVADRQPVPVTR
jgi:hypothetical protein